MCNMRIICKTKQKKRMLFLCDHISSLAGEEKNITLVRVTMTGTADVSNCRNSSSLMSTSGCSSLDALAATETTGIPVLIKAALKNNRNKQESSPPYMPLAI